MARCFRVPSSRHLFLEDGCSALEKRAVIKGRPENSPAAAKYQGQASWGSFWVANLLG